MNTLDVEVNIKINNEKELLKFAKEQFEDYEKIEGIEDWSKYDFSIDCSQDQAKFKDMFQIRFIEELTEATEDKQNPDHFYEEITDSFNFFISGLIMYGYDFEKKPLGLDKLRSISSYQDLTDKDLFAETYRIVEATGKLCNLLKNRPWSQSNYLVSMIDFEERLDNLINIYLNYLSLVGMSSEKLFDLFARKMSVNLFRIRTGY